MGENSRRDRNSQHRRAARRLWDCGRAMVQAVLESQCSRGVWFEGQCSRGVWLEGQCSRGVWFEGLGCSGGIRELTTGCECSLVSV